MVSFSAPDERQRNPHTTHLEVRVMKATSCGNTFNFVLAHEPTEVSPMATISTVSDISRIWEHLAQQISQNQRTMPINPAAA